MNHLYATGSVDVDAVALGIVILATSVVALAAFPYYSGAVARLVGEILRQRSARPGKHGRRG